MEEILKEVLIKKVGDRKHDQVLVIENLPSKFLYEQTRKMAQQFDRDGYPLGTMTVDKSGELVWTLRPGVEHSQTKDGGFVFSMGDRESEERLADIMHYVEFAFPRDQRIPSFVDNAQMRGESNTGPLSRDMIPHVELPAPQVPQTISPAPAPAPSPAPQERPQEPSGTLTNRATKWTPERKAAQAEKMRQMHLNKKKVAA